MTPEEKKASQSAIRNPQSAIPLERWEQVKQLCHSALQRAPSERATFLDQAYEGDEGLRREVESLLANEEEAERFIETSALEVAAIEMGRDSAPSLVGQQIGHYELLSLIGAGGMGEVYRARDTRLGRMVAIKLLPASVSSDQERMRRFIIEARAASALNHPNIATIHEIGEDGASFIVMELVEGETLEFKIGGHALEPAEILVIGIQVADALDEAHAKGITHRDIKPANIMLTARAQVKLLDFGIAKIARPENQAPDSSPGTTAMTTQPGVVMGTVQYMSPEQVLGREADHRTDIFSLGVVLYEMTTGRLPFSRSSLAETMDRIMHARPEALARFNNNVSAELERIVRKCLESDPGRRYQSARDLLVDLRNLQRDRDAPPSRRRQKAIDSLAILPLVNASADPNFDYLSDGITESLINSLSKLPRLRVMARSTVFRYKGQQVDPQQVGRDLNVRAVLTGRVLQLGDHLIIGAELVDVVDGSQLWGEQYNRQLSDIFALQDEISKEIGEKLRLRLSGKEKKQLTKRYTENTEAYHDYLKGRLYWNKFTENGLKNGIEYFTRAIEKDPNFGLAYSNLSDCYAVLGVDYMAPNEAFPKAIAATVRALEIDDALAEAHTSRGAQKLLYERDWVGAERELKRAIDLNPGLATAYELYAYYLQAMGRADEAIAEMKRAQELDPLSLVINLDLGWAYIFVHDYDRALEQSWKTLEIDPDFALTHLVIGMAYEQKGLYEEAIAELNSATDLSGGNLRISARLGHAYATAGKSAEAHRMLDSLKELSKRSNVDPYNVAVIYAGLGEKNETFEWLKKSVEERSAQLTWLKVEPIFDGLRSDTRFLDLLRSTGLAP